MTQSKFLRPIGWVPAIASCAVLVLTIAAVFWNWNSRRQAAAMLTLARTVRVGESTLADLMQAARLLRVATHAREDWDGHHTPIEKVPISSCVSSDCVIFLGSDPWDQQGFLYDLQIRSEKLRKWLPWNTFSVAVSTSNHVVQGMELYAHSVDDKIAYVATSRITADKNASAWRIRRGGGGFEGPGNMSVGMQMIEIRSGSDTVPARKIGALDFDVSCMGVTKHCSTCQLLPFACQDYEHGDWLYFEMSRDLLDNFEAAVNELSLGTSSQVVQNRLGSSETFGRQLFQDKLPYLFQDRTVFGDAGRLIYYTRKWRREVEENSQDRAVTIVFDRDNKLAGIESNVEGIRSRP